MVRNVDLNMAKIGESRYNQIPKSHLKLIGKIVSFEWNQFYRYLKKILWFRFLDIRIQFQIDMWDGNSGK